MPASRVECVIRSTSRVMMTTLAMPASAGPIRQPNDSRCCGACQKSSGSAISHLPSGGWTMNM